MDKRKNGLLANMKNLFAHLILLLMCNIFLSCFDEISQKYIFIGDSLVDNYDTDKFFPSLYVENKGVSGYTIQDCQNLNLNCKGHVAVLLIGTNNLWGNLDADFMNAFIEEYIELVDALQADKVIVISLLPRNDRDNTQINLLNHSLRDTFSNQTDILFLDVFADFLKERTMNPEYTTDGLHLNDWGYMLLSERLNQVL
jgi:lysophospholipase L1-like esterase